MSLPWFRMYAEFAGDPVIQSLAFEDQRHYIILLCLKCNGTLDRDLNARQREPIILRGLGLDPITGAEVKRRLMEVALIDKNWHPLGWEKRQYVQQQESAAKLLVYFIGDPNGSTIKIGYSKNPWARLKEAQTGDYEALSVVATVVATVVEGQPIHDLFSAVSIEGDWFNRSPELNEVIEKIKSKDLKTDTDVVNYVASLRSATTSVSVSVSVSDSVSNVFNYWKEKLNHPRAVLTDDRKKKIRRALEHYSAEDLRKAIDGCAVTPHNMGQNDSGEKYDDIELIVRDAKHVERFMRNADNPPVGRTIQQRPSELQRAAGAIRSAHDAKRGNPPKPIQMPGAPTGPGAVAGGPAVHGGGDGRGFADTGTD